MQASQASTNVTLIVLCSVACAARTAGLVLLSVGTVGVLLLAFSWGMFAMQGGRLGEQDAAGCVMATKRLQCEWKSFGSWKGGALSA